MSTAILPKNQYEFAFKQKDFERVRRFIYQKAGIHLAQSKDSMVYSRLARRIRALNLTSFDAYLKYLQTTPEEEQAFVNALTTNLTAFYREPHHFRELAVFLRTHRRPITIWCAASSSGEEPYSIAMTVVETLGRFDVPVNIIASDIDSNVLNYARAGIYPMDITKKLTPAQCKQFLYKGKGRHKGKVKVVDELKQLISFRQINLTDSQWSIRGPIDIIFCRNVMIYFDRKTQLSILGKMVQLMPHDGLYVAGHSENFNSEPNLVKPLGKTTYRPVKG